MFKLLQFLFRYAPGQLTLAVLSAIATGACNTFLINWLNMAIVGFATVDIFYLVRFFGVCLLLPATLIASQLLLSYMSQNVVYDMRMDLSKKILGAQLREVEKQGSNKILAAITTDIETLSATLMNLPMICMQAAILLTCLGYLFYLFWIAAVGVVIAILIGVGLFSLVTGKGERLFHLNRLRRDNLFKDFEVLTHGTKELKLHAGRRNAFFNDMLHSTADDIRRYSIKGFVYFAVAGSFSRFFFFVIIGLYVFFLPDILDGVTQEVLMGYAIALIYSLFPLASLTNAIPIFVGALISLNKLESLGIAMAQEGEMKPAQRGHNSPWTRTSYRGITHAYHREREDSNFTLGPIDLDIEPGELIFLVGGNGSGKTTLAKLLCGLYTPEKGSIKIDDLVIDADNREELRQMFAAVFNDFYLFEDMLGLGEVNISERVNDYLKKLHLDHKVTFENGKLSSLDLSQGQRKRLALLTAYMEDRSIYLFDEWAADQDPNFKNVFYQELLPELRERGKAVIVISHDDRYFHLADRIIKLEAGKIEYIKEEPSGD